MRQQINANETVEVPRGVSIADSPPPDGPYVNLLKTRSGSWQAQHWFRVDGQLIADYMDEHTAKRDAIEDALRVAKAEDLTFVRKVEEEREAMYVESTVVE